MDTRTGEIGSHEVLSKRVPEKYLKAVLEENLSQEIRDELAKGKTAFLGRNSPCPCGSMKRFKRCCMVHTKTAQKYINKHECAKGKVHPQHR